METNTQKEIKNQVVSKTTNENPNKIVPIWKSQLDRYESGKIKNS